MAIKNRGTFVDIAGETRTTLWWNIFFLYYSQIWAITHQWLIHTAESISRVLAFGGSIRVWRSVTQLIDRHLPFLKISFPTSLRQEIYSSKTMLFQKAAILSSFVPAALACLAHEGGIPEATDVISNDAVIEIAAGDTFDGEWAKYDRGSGACNEQNEGDWKDAVFYLHAGATLKNVIIGADQAEGVHCDGPCTLEFVWFEDVCEDAISIVCSNILYPCFYCARPGLTWSAEKWRSRRWNLYHWWRSLFCRWQGCPAQWLWHRQRE